MALTPGTRLGVYEVIAQIGAGGMGQVYRATDTKLKRQVAIKILPPSLAADADRLARFQREAEVLASLNHPNIAHIHGLEESGGITALVMELVEGDDLSQRIARGAIPLDEALPIAKQIAEALEAAHEQGIIHRDLKPANIKVRRDGTVKVLDFGLAKAMEPAGAMSASMSMSPTITTPAMTQAGMILGTAAYLSPEQARGRTVDRRADIWAFGAVLFEMLTGQRAFPGEDLTDTLASVVKLDPKWDAVGADIPPRVCQVLRVCLQKDPRQRAQSIGDLRLALEGAFETPAPHAGAPLVVAPRRRVALASTAALLGGVVIATTLMWFATRPADPVPPRVSRLLDRYPLWTPDGKAILYYSARSGMESLYRKMLDTDRAEEQLFADATRLVVPWSWSADGQTLITSEFALSGSIGYDVGTLSLSGKPAWKGLLGSAFEEAQPVVSPDGKWMAYSSTEGGGDNGVYVRPFPDVTAGVDQVSTEGGSDPFWTRDGRELMYRRGDTIMAVPVALSQEFRASTPEVLFKGTYFFDIGRQWDVTRDGKRFLMLKPAVESDAAGREQARPQITIVLNWFEELKRLVPTK